MLFRSHHTERLGRNETCTKQYVRDWLKANPDNDFLLPEEVVTKTVDKYKEAYELLTGKPFTR